MSTWRQVSQDTLKIANGGRRNSQEQGWSENLVMQMFQSYRDMYAENDIRKTEKSEQPEQAYYTEYPDVDLLWDETRKVMYLDLPNGTPMDVLHDRGVRILPVSGAGGQFIRCPSGWCDANPELAWLEGNIAWELRRGRIIFPAMQRGALGKVSIHIIETGGTIDPDKPMAMPARHLALCRREILRDMGVSMRDTTANFVEEIR